MEIQPVFVNTATGSTDVRLSFCYFQPLWNSVYCWLPETSPTFISVSALLHYPRLLIKVTIIFFLEPPLFDSVVVDAVKITVPLYLLLSLMVTHSCVSISSLSWPSKPFSTSSSFSLLSHVLGTLFLSLRSQTIPQMDGESQFISVTPVELW